MKKLLVSMVLVFAATPALAQFAFDLPHLDFPTESGWSVFMVEKACGVKFDESYTGSMVRKADGSVTYLVYNTKGKAIAGASAASGALMTKLSCL